MQQYINSVLRQILAVFYKNLRNHLSSKKKLIGQLIFPLIISAIYFTTKKFQTDLTLSMLLNILLKMYIGLIGVSAVRQIVTLFITERSQSFRQYQTIFGLSHKIHLFSNLLYMCMYFSFFLLPFFLTIEYFTFSFRYIFMFGSFVLSSMTLSLMLTAFFSDQKIALEIIGMLFSLSAFLPYFYKSGDNSWLNYLIMVIPNSSFTIAILENDLTPSFVSLFLVKFYLILYSLVEFPDYYTDKIRACCRFLGRNVQTINRQPTNLMQEFELNEVIASELQPQRVSTHSQIVIRTEALVKTYNVNGSLVSALNGVNLRIYQSQIFGLLGRNGAGKTTLVDILTQVTTPSQGTFQLVKDCSIGICYQHQVLYQSITVNEHLRFYSLLKTYELENGETREQHIQQIVKTLGIESQLLKQVKELSGGNKRKLSIAIAIIGRPKILIFDEPTSGLDPLSRIAVWEVFEQLRRGKSTIILTTHHLDQAQKLSDWVCVIEKGQVIVQNTAEKIKEKYGKGYHLEITSHSETFQENEVQKYRQIAQAKKLKALQLEKVPGVISLLIKPLNKDQSSQEFEYAFVELLGQLQKQEGIDVCFHSNTLEQSFIAILRDTDNGSGDSLDESTLALRPSDLIKRSGICGWLCTVWGVFLKSLYYQKSIFLQSVILYNINIIVFLLATFFNAYIKQYLSKADDKQGEVPSSNQTILLQGYIIMATAFITAPVYEKEKKIRSVLNTRGLTSSAYWIGTFLFDFSAFLINLFAISWIAPREVQAVGLLALVQLGVGLILFSYCMSFLFDKAKTANTWFSVLNMLLGMIIMPMIIFGKSSFLKYFDFLKYLYPYYDLTVKVFFDGPTGKQLSVIMGLSVPQGGIIIINIIVYLLLLILIELRIITRIRYYCNWTFTQQTSTQRVRLQNVSKNYGQIQALKSVSYHVGEQRLALLGHNGAGKSTTFSILSSQQTPDNGKVYLQQQLSLPFKRQMKSTGICYQDDALWEGMLVNEILHLFSWLVPIKNNLQEVKWLYESMEYDANNNYKRFSNLSGGNKRKLCMMISLYGDPELRLLDQCSTGLDPSSRLAMVETIKHSKVGSTIFTTHSMGEAQNLCTKAVIMSKGRVLQFDLIAKLRSRHFKCCWVDIRTDPDINTDKLGQELEQTGVKAIVKEKGNIRLQLDKSVVNKSKLLSKLLQMKGKLIKTFNWIEPRLQDVYIKVTRQNGDGQLVTLSESLNGAGQTLPAEL